MRRAIIIMGSIGVLVGGLIGLGYIVRPKANQSSVSIGACAHGCTKSEIAQHNNAKDCWVIYSGKVYDITPYVGQHPGSAAVYNAQTCGHDITAYLQGEASSAGRQHTHSANAFATLANYQIGIVKD